MAAAGGGDRVLRQIRNLEPNQVLTRGVYAGIFEFLRSGLVQSSIKLAWLVRTIFGNARLEYQTLPCRGLGSAHRPPRLTAMKGVIR